MQDPLSVVFLFEIFEEADSGHYKRTKIGLFRK